MNNNKLLEYSNNKNFSIVLLKWLSEIDYEFSNFSDLEEIFFSDEIFLIIKITYLKKKK